MSNNESLYSSLPSVHECLDLLTKHQGTAFIPYNRLKTSTRLFLDHLRQRIQLGSLDQQLISDKKRLVSSLVSFTCRYHQPHLIRVINATGIIVHTNLGRSLLPRASADVVVTTGLRYSNLEFDLENGRRGSRYAIVDRLLCELTGAESSLVVNNNAAAVFLALNTLAQGREVIVSRGQLVEIGGSFRIPDVMDRSGARLIEVGTTNRTHLLDYERAMTDETSLLLKVHSSNYRIIGFTSDVPSADLSRLGKEKGVATMEDLGSGCMIDLRPYGLVGEPTVQEVIKSGMDIVTFSGDKLLGGPQAGIILGKKQYIEKMRQNPLNRALRIDKLTLAALESVLRLYLDPEQALRQIPTLAMIAENSASVARRAKRLARRLKQHLAAACEIDCLAVNAQVGGGALPMQELPSWSVRLRPKGFKCHQLEQRLRLAAVPVIARIENDALLLDMRTVADDELGCLVESLLFAFNEK